MDVFTEHRMAADYGDYLAVSLDKYKGDGMKDIATAILQTTNSGVLQALLHVVQVKPHGSPVKRAI